MKKAANGCDIDWRKNSNSTPRPKAGFPPLSQQPLRNARYRTLHLQTTVGEIRVRALYGQDPHSDQGLCPIRQRGGLAAHQTMSVALEEKLCFTATLTGSYETAAQVAQKWGAPADDSTIHAHVQRAGACAQALHQARVDRALAPAKRGEAVAQAARDLEGQEFSLVIEIDGWMVRERGAQWGLKPPEKQGDRVDWREMKTGIVFRLDQRVQTGSQRPAILDALPDLRAPAGHVDAEAPEPQAVLALFLGAERERGLLRFHVARLGAPFLAGGRVEPPHPEPGPQNRTFHRLQDEQCVLRQQQASLRRRLDGGIPAQLGDRFEPAGVPREAKAVPARASEVRDGFPGDRDHRMAAAACERPISSRIA